MAKLINKGSLYSFSKNAKRLQKIIKINFVQLAIAAIGVLIFNLIPPIAKTKAASVVDIFLCIFLSIGFAIYTIYDIFLISATSKARCNEVNMEELTKREKIINVVIGVCAISSIVIIGILSTINELSIWLSLASIVLCGIWCLILLIMRNFLDTCSDKIEIVPTKTLAGEYQ